MDDMATVYSTEYGEDIQYYVRDLTFYSTIFGCGCDTGRGYYLTFDDDDYLEEVNLIED